MIKTMTVVICDACGHEATRQQQEGALIDPNLYVRVDLSGSGQRMHATVCAPCGQNFFRVAAELGLEVQEETSPPTLRVPAGTLREADFYQTLGQGNWRGTEHRGITLTQNTIV